MRFGIIGDFDPNNPTHVGTNSALNHAGPCSIEWLATNETHDYGPFDGLVCSPGSPYLSEQGALDAVRYARECNVPLLATCGGFQHLILEYARNVAGFEDAAHEENDPSASVFFLQRLACSLGGKTLNVSIQPGTLAHKCYASAMAEERYYCNFGLNPEYRSTLLDAGLVVSGWDDTSEVRIIELPGHPFFLGTVFVPQMRSTSEHPHPLVTGFYNACRL